MKNTDLPLGVCRTMLHKSEPCVGQPDAKSRHEEIYIQAYRLYYKDLDYHGAYRLLTKHIDCSYAPILRMLGTCLSDPNAVGLRVDYTEAMELYSRAAALGDYPAMCYLGIFSEMGRDVNRDTEEVHDLYARGIKGMEDYIADSSNAEDLPLYLTILGDVNLCCARLRDFGKACELYCRAAEQGFAEAMNNLAELYLSGNGAERDRKKACEWFHKAAQQGFATAIYNMGILYLNGCGAEQNYGKAFGWFHKAAELGFTAAMYKLGYLYTWGIAVNKDFAEAVKWYEKAAGLGDTRAMNELGLMYKYGWGVEQDLAKAAGWLKKAAGLGDAQALETLNSPEIQVAPANSRHCFA